MSGGSVGLGAGGALLSFWGLGTHQLHEKEQKERKNSSRAQH
jgi:hypothetical protein